jgi:hypothetical protein
MDRLQHAVIVLPSRIGWIITDWWFKTAFQGQI